MQPGEGGLGGEQHCVDASGLGFGKRVMRGYNWKELSGSQVLAVVAKDGRLPQV